MQWQTADWDRTGSKLECQIRWRMHRHHRTDTTDYICLPTSSHPVCCKYLTMVSYPCIFHQEGPDERVHQAKNRGLTSGRGMWHEHKDDTQKRLHTSLHRACVCECMWPRVCVWVRAIVHMSLHLCMGCDNVDGCHCHLWLQPQQMGFDGSNNKCRKSHL